MRPRRPAVLLLGPLVTLALAACGGGGEGASAAACPPAEHGQGAAGQGAGGQGAAPTGGGRDPAQAAAAAREHLARQQVELVQRLQAVEAAVNGTTAPRGGAVAGKGEGEGEGVSAHAGVAPRTVALVLSRSRAPGAPGPTAAPVEAQEAGAEEPRACTAGQHEGGADAPPADHGGKAEKGRKGEEGGGKAEGAAGGR